MVIKMKKIIIIFTVIILLVISYFTFFNKQKITDGVIDEVNGYVLSSNKSDYYNSLFEELKTMYTKEYEDNEKASLITQLFLTDNLSLSTAQSKNDVGGVQYVYEDFREEFTKIARNTIYKFVENNVYGTRKQELPTVSEVLIEKISDSEFKIGKEKVDVLLINAKIKYEKDLGYQKEVELLLYKKNDKFEVIKMD